MPFYISYDDVLIVNKQLSLTLKGQRGFQNRARRKQSSRTRRKSWKGRGETFRHFLMITR
jgi:hypothetical protein